MKTIEYSFIDKTTWTRGEWDSEPDKVQWPDPTTGLPCLAVRNPVGCWCGYVAVSEAHPWFEKHYTDKLVQIDCHNELTFSNFCVHNDKEHGICHMPDQGEPERVWWFGFDCAHSGDLMPAIEAKLGGLISLIYPDTYKNLAYVRKGCTEIAWQLASVSRD
jgi:hypothetical protein